jgi:hypothetical protein
MITSFARFIKRLLVFVPGAAVAFYVVRDVYPILDKQIPAAPAILLAYLLAAYIFIPGLIRLFRLAFPPKHIPLYSTTPDGFASDPIQIGLFGTREQVIGAMNKIGWHQADGRTPKTLLKLGLSLLLRKSYKNAPFSKLYLLGHSQDLGFQLPVDNNPRQRHHVRFWPIKSQITEQFKEHIEFWEKHHPDKNKHDDKILWLGAASLDIGLGLIRHNAQITHMIHPDTNAERELIVSSLKKAKVCKNVKRIPIAKPYQLRNRVITGYLEADGNLTICEL